MSKSRDVIDRVTTQFTICDFLLMVHSIHCNQISISSLFRDNGFNHIRVMYLTFQGHVTSSITIQFSIMRLPIAGPVEPSLSTTVFEIFGYKHIWGTTLTFWGHVTSSDTWPFDTTYTISYRCSIQVHCNQISVSSRFRGNRPKHIRVTTLNPRRLRHFAWRSDGAGGLTAQACSWEKVRQSETAIGKRCRRSACD